MSSITDKKTLVPAVCPQCGASIEVDKNLEKGFCSYCGTKIIIKDVIQKVKVVNNTSFEKFKKLADRYYEDGNYSEALDNYKAALEIEPDDWSCIYRKGVCVARTTTLGNFDIDAVVKASKSALKLYEEKDKEKLAEVKVRMAYDIYKIAGDAFVSAINHYAEYMDLEKSASEMWNRLLCVKECLLYVKDELLTDEIMKLCPKTYTNEDTTVLRNVDLQMLVSCDVELCEVRKYKSGYTQYGPIYSNTKIRDDLRNSFVKEYDELVAEIKKFDVNYVPKEINRTGQAKGCYVATAVYGSYDCPEVWILRRYRDYKLDNNVFGRMFIKAYYAVSPKIVSLFGNNRYFNKINKYILDKFVNKLQESGYENTRYNDKY